VIAGVVRDVEILRDTPLGIKALGSVPLKTDKRGEGQQDIPIEVGGVTVHPGDYVYADANGVLVSSTSLL
jgi:regulator of ribonuclease activity A